MTSGLRTCFKLAALLPAVAVASSGARADVESVLVRATPALMRAHGAAVPAAVSGRVRLTDSSDPAVKSRQDNSGVVVWLEPSGEAPGVAAARSGPPARMEQRGKRFIPHVVAIPVGGSVVFPNYDPIFHNAFSNFAGQVFDLGLYAPGQSRTVRFDKPGIVRVFCNIHPSMSAVIAVMKSPWFAVSDRTGEFTIADVPPGEYTVHVFHERATAATLKALSRKLTVDSGSVTVPLLEVSETGYIQTPHRNKYGQDYPPVVEDGGLYPGNRK